jgi:carbonic anhydrase
VTTAVDPLDLVRGARGRLTVITCMDRRIEAPRFLGLEPGDAHVLRNAGAYASDDAIRSVVVSRAMLGTTTVAVVGHTDCRMNGLPEDRIRAELADRTGSSLELDLGGFEDLEANVRAQVERIRVHPWLADLSVHGFVYELETGSIRLVT